MILLRKLQSTLQPAAEVLTFLEESATKCRLELSCHSLRCGNYPLYTWSLDSLGLILLEMAGPQRSNVYVREKAEAVQELPARGRGHGRARGGRGAG